MDAHLKISDDDNLGDVTIDWVKLKIYSVYGKVELGTTSPWNSSGPAASATKSRSWTPAT